MPRKITTLGQTTPADWLVALDYVRDTLGDHMVDELSPDYQPAYLARCPLWLDELLAERLAWRPGYGNTYNPKKIDKIGPTIYRAHLHDGTTLKALLRFIGGSNGDDLICSAVYPTHYTNVLPAAWGKEWLPRRKNFADAAGPIEPHIELPHVWTPIARTGPVECVMHPLSQNSITASLMRVGVSDDLRGFKSTQREVDTLVLFLTDLPQL